MPVRYFIVLEVFYVDDSVVIHELARDYNPVKLAADSRDEPLKDYPPLSARWHIPLEQWDMMEESTGIEVPDSPWSAFDHPWRQRARARGIAIDEPLTSGEIIDPARTTAWQQLGLQVDTRGRALHPLAKLGVTSCFGEHAVGMYTSLGRGYYYGPQLTATIGVARELTDGTIEYAAITKSKSAQPRWSLPGGHVELGQTIEEAAYQEGYQEAGLAVDMLAGLSRHHLSIAPSLFGPNTLFSWLAENMIMVDGASLPALRHFELQVHNTDEIAQAAWLPASAIVSGEIDFTGSHQKAVAWLEAHRAHERGM